MYPVGAKVDPVNRKAATANAVPPFQDYDLVSPVMQRACGSDAGQTGADHDDVFELASSVREFPGFFGVLNQNSLKRNLVTNL